MKYKVIFHKDIWTIMLNLFRPKKQSQAGHRCKDVGIDVDFKRVLSIADIFGDQLHVPGVLSKFIHNN